MVLRSGFLHWSLPLLLFRALFMRSNTFNSWLITIGKADKLQQYGHCHAERWYFISIFSQQACVLEGPCTYLYTYICVFAQAQSHFYPVGAFKIFILCFVSTSHCACLISALTATSSFNPDFLYPVFIFSINIDIIIVFIAVITVLSSIKGKLPIVRE